MCAVGVPIVGMEPDPLARVQERTRHPGGREAQDALAGVERTAQESADVIFLGDIGARLGGCGHDVRPEVRRDVDCRRKDRTEPGNRRNTLYPSEKWAASSSEMRHERCIADLCRVDCVARFNLKYKVLSTKYE